MVSKKSMKYKRGGARSQKTKIVETGFSITNLVLMGVFIFLLYNLVNNLRPKVIIQKQEPSVIYKEVIKEKEDEPYREDVYKPDLNRRIRTPPFNYPTRGPPEEYNMVGFLQDSDDSNKLQQLFGRRTYPNSNNWNYYVKSDQYHQIPIPVTVNGKNCTDENGCTELNNKDSINLLNKEHTATIYKPEPYYYDPRV